MREVLRRTSTYMTWDDHEIRDDWGCPRLDHNREMDGDTPPAGKEYEYFGAKDEIFQAARRAYQIFQQAHNPGGFDGSFYYSFRRGPAAFFVTDCRSERGRNLAYPILGETQWKAIETWARDPQTRAADIIFFVTSVPMAFLPVEEIIRLRKELIDAAPRAGLIGGARKGARWGALFGPAGAFAGSVVGAGYGYAKGEEEAEKLSKEDILTKYDLADHWTWGRNQVELKRVLDLLFELADDAQGGGRRPRAVFVLGGDVHSGAMHVITCRQNGSLPRNKAIYQLISSPISREPASHKIYDILAKHFQPGKHISATDLMKADFNAEKLVTNKFPSDSSSQFALIEKTADGKVFSTEIMDLRPSHNFGHVAVERVSPDKRIYRFRLSIEGYTKADSLFQDIELNLDASPITPTPIAGNWGGGKSLGGVITSPPHAVSWGPNRLDVFALGQDRAVWHQAWDGRAWSGWGSLGGIKTSPPHAVSWGSNRLDVFALGQDRAVWHQAWDGRAWSGWGSLGGVKTSPPSAVSWGPNRLDVFALGQDRAVWHKGWEGSSWSGWIPLGGQMLSPVSAVSREPNRLDIFAVGTDTAVWHRAWDGAKWSDWRSLGGSSISSPVSAVSWGPKRLDLFVIGGDKAVWHQAWDGSRWSGWESFGGSFSSPVSAVSWGPNRLDYFALGSDSAVWHQAWDGANRSGWKSLGVPVVSPVSAVSWRPSRLDVFALDHQRTVMHQAWK
jgi:hypothetical protein